MSGITREDRRFGAAAAVISLFVFALCFAGHYSVRDNIHRLAWARTLLESGSHDISAHVPGVRYSMYGIGQTILHVPFLFVSQSLERIFGSSPEMAINMTPYLLNGVAGVFLFYLFLRRYGRTPREAFAGSLILGIATIWFPYTKVEHGEPLVVTLMLAAFLVASRAPLAAGLIGGFSIAIRLDSVLWLSLTILFSPSTWKQKLRMTLGTLPGVLLMMWSNQVRTDSWFRSGYQPDFVNPMFTGVYGLLFSSGKSVFLFAPILILFVFAARETWRNPALRHLVLWTAALFGGQILFYSRWWAWGGEDAWGPRFLLLSMMAGQILVLISGLYKTRAFKLLVAVSFVIHLLPVLIGPHTSLVIGYLRKPMKNEIMLVDERLGPITYEDIRFNPKYSQITQTWQLLRLKVLGTRTEYSKNTHVGTPYTLVGTSWIESFDPPLTREEVPIDLLWYNVLRKRIDI